jgi:hypothetical protein
LLQISWIEQDCLGIGLRWADEVQVVVYYLDMAGRNAYGVAGMVPSISFGSFCITSFG